MHGDVGTVRTEVEIGWRFRAGFLLSDNARGHLRKARAAGEIHFGFEAVSLGKKIFQLSETFLAAEGRRAGHKRHFSFFLCFSDDLLELLRMQSRRRREQ